MRMDAFYHVLRIDDHFMWGGPAEAVSKLGELFILQFAGSAGVSPAAAKQMKESKSQSKQDDAKRCHTTGAKVVLCFSSLRLGFC
jgi:hypothetical protein